jgi:hypothetical protein
MSRRAVSFIAIVSTAASCLSVDDGEPAFEPPDASSGSVVTTSTAAGSGGRGGDAVSTGSATMGGNSGAGGGGGVSIGGGAQGGGRGGAAGGRSDAGVAGRGGSAGSGTAGAPVGDGGARVCKGGTTGMCPPAYAASGTIDDICKTYCDCMTAHCPDTLPASCAATCKSQIDKWDICCRINKCLTRPCDYKDQFIGDCKAAVGVQACLDRG